MFFEHGREVGLVVEAHGVSHLRDVDLSFFYQACCLFQSQVADEFSGRYTCYLLELAVQLGTADTHICRKFLHVQILIG